MKFAGGAVIADSVHKPTRTGTTFRMTFKSTQLNPICRAIVQRTRANPDQPPRRRPAKRIEEVQVGDLVWAWDESRRKLVKRQVRRLFRHEDKPTLKVVIAAGNEAEAIEATFEHPFFVPGKGWVAARALCPGEVLQRLGGEGDVTVRSVRPSGRRSDVFNFEVEGVHNYFVGLRGVLVHNASEKPNASPHPLAGEPSAFWGSRAGIELPPVGSAGFGRLVDGIRTQFAITNSYAMVPTGFASPGSTPGRIHLPASNKGDLLIVGRQAPIDQLAPYDVRGSRSPTFLDPGTLTSMESLRAWGHTLLGESLGWRQAPLSEAQYHYSKPQPVPQDGYQRAASLWHPDGPRIIYGMSIATEGPGTDSMLFQPGQHLPGMALKYAPDSPSVSVPTWSLYVFTGSGIQRYRDVGHVPTIHRTPNIYPVDRSLYLIRVGDGQR